MLDGGPGGGESVEIGQVAVEQGLGGWYLLSELEGWSIGELGGGC